MTGNVNNLIGAAVTPRSGVNWFNFSDDIFLKSLYDEARPTLRC